MHSSLRDFFHFWNIWRRQCCVLWCFKKPDRYLIKIWFWYKSNIICLRNSFASMFKPAYKILKERVFFFRTPVKFLKDKWNYFIFQIGKHNPINNTFIEYYKKIITKYVNIFFQYFYWNFVALDSFSWT